MSMKNRLIFALVQLLKPNVPSLQRTRHFLVVSTTGLGDTLWGTPAIRALRSSYPASRISVLTSPIGQEILRHNRHIDEIFVVKDPVFTALIPLYFTLKKKEITDVLHFHTSQRPILPLTAVLGASSIVGTAGMNKGLDSLLTNPLPSAHMHEIERRLKVIQQVGAQSVDPSLELFISPEDEQEADRFLSGLNLPSYLPIISMHPGAKDLFKQWPPSHFIELGHRLIQHLGCQILITGTPAEKELVLEIANKIPGAIPVTHLKLRPFAALMKRMKLMITNDTGPMHVAFAMRTPTVALFTPTDPDLCGPYHAKHVKVIAKERTCTPCLRKKCREPFCLLQIGVSEVTQAAVELFHNPLSGPPHETRSSL
jgi:ADP-heptose:LPS heptosyltransferase